MYCLSWRRFTAGGSEGLRGIFTLSSAPAGSIEFFEQLTMQHLTDSYQTARALLGNQTAAREVVESTYLEARQSLSTLPNISVRVWLFGILINTIRRRRRWSLPFGSSRKDSGSPDDEVLNVLRRMPLSEAEPVLLCDVEGFTHAELQQILALPAASVEERLAKGRLRLQEALDPGVECAKQLVRVQRNLCESSDHRPV
jgi:DNA-directed RNA polymerase specialized sigma24 family protein